MSSVAGHREVRARAKKGFVWDEAGIKDRNDGLGSTALGMWPGQRRYSRTKNGGNQVKKHNFLPIEYFDWHAPLAL